MIIDPTVTYADACELIVESVRENYLEKKPSDQDVVDVIQQAANLAWMAKVSPTEYLRLAMRGLKEARRRDLAKRLHDEIYMPIIQGDE